MALRGEFFFRSYLCLTAKVELCVRLRSAGVELRAMKFSISAVEGDQLIVRSVFGHDTLFDDNNLVGVTNCAQPMSDGDDSAALHQPLQGIDYQPFRLAVERRRRLVENQNRAIPDHHSRDAN